MHEIGLSKVYAVNKRRTYEAPKKFPKFRCGFREVMYLCVLPAQYRQVLLRDVTDRLTANCCRRRPQR